MLAFGGFSQMKMAKFSYYNTTNGLSQNSVYCIIQDKDGIIWCSTQSGIDKFDGLEFTHKSIANKKLNENIVNIYKKDHYIYAASNENLYVINPDTLSKNITADFKEILTIDEANNKIILFAKSSIIEINNNIDINWKIEFKNNLKLNSIRLNCVAAIDNNSFFLGTSNGLYIYENNEKNVYPLNIDNLNENILAINYDRVKKEAIIGYKNYNEVFSIINGRILNRRKYKISENNLIITSILKTSLGNGTGVWVATSNLGIFHYPYDNIWESDIKPINYRAEGPFDNTISSNNITCITESEDGVIWFGTTTEGISYYPRNKQYFLNYKEVAKKKVKNHIWSIKPISNYEALVGTDGYGIYFIDPYKFDSIANTEKWKVYSIKKRNKTNYLIGTDSGLYSVKINLPKRLAFDIKEISKGKILKIYTIPDKESAWFGKEDINSSSICFLDKNDKLISFPIPKNVSVTDIIEIKKQIFISTTNGLYYSNNSIDNIKNLDFKLILEKNQILCLETSLHSDTLWLGTSSGLKALNLTRNKLNEKELIKFAKFGLPEREVVYGIIRDKFSTLWLSTNHGLFRFDPQKKIVNYYQKSDGLQDNEFNGRAYSRFYERIFLGGINGVNSFIPIKIESTNKLKSNIAVKILYPDDSDRGYSVKILNNQNREITLRNDFFYAEVTPVIFNYHDLPNNQFRYKIDNQDWIYINKDKRLSFLLTPETGLSKSDIFPSKHTIVFQIRASNSNWSENESLEIQIIVEHNNKVVLSIFGAIVFLGLLFFILQNRNRNLEIRAQKEEIKALKQKKTYEINIRKLNSINKKIQEFSRLSSENEILKRIKEDFFSEEEGFNYDYFAFSKIDLFTQSVYTEEICDKQKYLIDKVKANFSGHTEYIKNENKITLIKCEDAEYWKTNSSYNAAEEDILVSIAKGLNPVIVIGKECFSATGARVDFVLKEEIYTKLNHKCFTRIFFPIVYRSLNRLASQDTPLCVLEVGYIHENEFDFESEKSKLINNVEYNQTYIDNISQSLFKAIVNKSTEKLNEKINLQYDLKFNEKNTDIDDNFYKLPIIFLKDVLQDICSDMQIKYSNIAMLSCNFEKLNILEYEIFHGFDLDYFNNKNRIKDYLEGIKLNKKGLSRISLQENRTIYTNNPKTLYDYIPAFENVESELVSPLLNYSYSKEPIGVWILSSVHKGFFNELFKEIIENICLNLSEKYLSAKRFIIGLYLADFPKKRFETVDQKFINESKKILSIYFNSDKILVWKNENGNFKLISNYNDDDIKLKEFVENRKDSLFPVYENGYNLIAIDENEIKDLHGYRNILQIVTESEGIPFLIYMIFSKRRINEKLPIQDINIIKQYNASVSSNIQEVEILSSIKILTDITDIPDIIPETIDISDISISKDLYKEKLKKVLEDGKRIFQADLVTLFLYTNEQEIRVKDAINDDEKFFEGQKIDGEKTADMANAIIALGDNYINSEEEYLQILNWGDVQKNKESKNKFWQKNNIKSIIAIRVTYKENYLGVLFFNYKREKKFTENTKALVKAFLDFVIIAIVYTDFTVKLSILLNRYKQRYDDVNKRIEKMYSNAVKSTFFEILNKVNHDVRHALIKVGVGMDRIDSSNLPNIDKNRFDKNRKTVDRNIQFISSLLDTFKFASTGNEYFSINELIETIIGIFENDKEDYSIQFDLFLNRGLEKITCSRYELALVIYNIITNAIDAIRETKRGNGKIKISTNIKNNSFLIIIEDNGIGINSNTKNEIFEYGFTTKDNGMGIGLFFAKETIYKSFNGRIEIASDLKSNNYVTKFSIYIPK